MMATLSGHKLSESKSTLVNLWNKMAHCSLAVLAEHQPTFRGKQFISEGDLRAVPFNTSIKDTGYEVTTTYGLLRVLGEVPGHFNKSVNWSGHWKDGSRLSVFGAPTTYSKKWLYDKNGNALFGYYVHEGVALENPAIETILGKARPDLTGFSRSAEYIDWCGAMLNLCKTYRIHKQFRTDAIDGAYFGATPLFSEPWTIMEARSGRRWVNGAAGWDYATAQWQYVTGLSPMEFYPTSFPQLPPNEFYCTMPTVYMVMDAANPGSTYYSYPGGLINQRTRTQNWLTSQFPETYIKKTVGKVVLEERALNFIDRGVNYSMSVYNSDMTLLGNVRLDGEDNPEFQGSTYLTYWDPVDWPHYHWAFNMQPLTTPVTTGFAWPRFGTGKNNQLLMIMNGGIPSDAPFHEIVYTYGYSHDAFAGAVSGSVSYAHCDIDVKNVG